jgi:hypothetical protein
MRKHADTRRSARPQSRPLAIVVASASQAHQAAVIFCSTMALCGSSLAGMGCDIDCTDDWRCERPLACSTTLCILWKACPVNWCRRSVHPSSSFVGFVTSCKKIVYRTSADWHRFCLLPMRDRVESRSPEVVTLALKEVRAAPRCRHATTRDVHDSPGSWREKGNTLDVIVRILAAVCALYIPPQNFGSPERYPQ